MPNIDQRRGRRRSASESDGDPLNSSTNPPRIPFNSNVYTPNVERCVSNPHINTTGFIDDSYRNSIGTRLQTGVVTRLQTRGESLDRNNRLREKFTKMKGQIYEWVHMISSSVQPIDVIENKHSLFCTEIDQLISEILLGRGDYALVGEFGSLKDKLDAARRDARVAARESSMLIPTSTPRIEPSSHQQINNSNHSRNSNLDDIFNSEDNIGGGVRQRSGLELSAIFEPPDNVSSNTVVGQGMEFNNLVGSNPPRQLSSPNPGTTLPPPLLLPRIITSTLSRI